MNRRFWAVARRKAGRALDVGIALGALIVLAPLVIFIGGVLSILNGGPILIRDLPEHSGAKEYRPFRFRTTISCSELTTDPLSTSRGSGGEAVGATKIGGNTLRDRFGVFLYQSGMEELPELLNILRGETSLVTR